jgi:undecaprenyl-diphosphatase
MDRVSGVVPASRSPADVLRLVVAAALLVVLLLVQWAFGDTLVTFASDLLAGFSALPQWIVNAGVIGTRALVALLLLLGVGRALAAGRLRAALTVGLGVALASAVWLLLDRLDVTPDGAQVAELSVDAGPLLAGPSATAFGIAAVAGALTAAAPWLQRSWRRWGWIAVLGLVWTSFLVAPVSFDAFESALAGWIGGAAALAILGAPSRRPTPGAITDGLAAVGLPLARLEPAAVDARGSTPYFGTDADAGRYFVKALGTDERSADLLFRLYRSARRRDLGDERPFSSLRRAVEHEAFVSLAVRDLGVRTPRLRALATAVPNAFVLAYDLVPGRSLDGVDAGTFTDEVLRGAWEQLALLRAHRIAHRDLRLANVFLGADGNVWLIDFGFSELAASDLLLATDVAELIASSSIAVGPERATAAAIGTVDPATLAAARGRLRPRVLSGATRTAMGQHPGLLDDLHARLDGR